MQPADAFLLAVVHGLPDPVVGVDASGRIRAWNAYAQKAFGYDEDEAYGSLVRGLLGVEVGKPGAPRQRQQARAKSGDVLHVSTETIAIATDASAPPSTAAHPVVALLVLRAEEGAAADADDVVAALPPRLQQTLEGLVAGLSEKEIAAKLGLSQHTIHGYVKALYKRTGVTNRVGLVQRVIVKSLEEKQKKS